MAAADTETRQGSAGEDQTGGTDWGSFSGAQGTHDSETPATNLYDWRTDVDTFDYGSYRIAGIYQNDYVLAQLAKQEAIDTHVPNYVWQTDSSGFGQMAVDVNLPEGPGATPYMGQGWSQQAGTHYTWVIDKDVRSEFLEQEASTLRDTFDVEAFNRRAQQFDYGSNPFGSSGDAAMALNTWTENVFDPNDVAAQREYNSLRFAQLEGGADALSEVEQYKLWRYEDRLVRTRDRAEALRQIGDEEAAAQLEEAGRIGTGEQWDIASDPNLTTTVPVGVGVTGAAESRVQLGRESSQDRAARARGKRQFTTAQL